VQIALGPERVVRQASGPERPRRESDTAVGTFSARPNPSERPGQEVEAHEQLAPRLTNLRSTDHKYTLRKLRAAFFSSLLCHRCRWRPSGAGIVITP